MDCSNEWCSFAEQQRVGAGKRLGQSRRAQLVGSFGRVGSLTITTPCCVQFWATAEMAFPTRG